MTTAKSRFCRWMELFVDLSIAGVLSHAGLSQAAAQTAGPGSAMVGAGVASGHEADLYLEVSLNYVELRRIAHFVLRNDELYADAKTLKDLGITWPGAATANGLIALADLQGLSAQLDLLDQRVEIHTTADMIGGPPLELGYKTPLAPHLDPASRAPGLLLNYDLYGQRARDLSSYSGWTELRMFGVGPGLWRTSNLLQSTSSDFGGREFRSTRLDSSWELDFPESMVSVTLGDTYSSAMSWSRATRMGGLRVSRNFDLQPYRVTVPLASFTGSATMPSVVDLFVNGIREAQTRVPPGQFQIMSSPVITGAGTAQMAITDITGQRRVINFSIYSSSRLLQQGLGDWSFEVGKVREDYGLRSFSYADSVAYSASARYGLTNHITLETHGEISDGVKMGGGGAVARIGQLGVINGSFASSSYRALRGNQYGAGYEWQSGRFSLNLSTLRRDKGFRDVGTLQGDTLPLRTSQAFLGWAIGQGQLGASYVRQDYLASPNARYVGLSWSQPLGKFGHITLGANRDLEGSSGNSAFLYWSLPLGDRTQLWSSSQHVNSGNTATIGATRHLPGDQDGWGWRLQAGAGEEGGAQGEVSQLTRYGEWRIGTQYWQNQEIGNTSVYAGAVGSLLLMKSNVFPMRRVYDSFALVSTDGVADVPVKLENRLVGKTDNDGYLLVTPLNAWQKNDLSIDPLVLPADVSVERVRNAAVPSTGSGMLVRFPMKTTLTIEFALRDSLGAWIPAGAQIRTRPGNRELIVGYAGRGYVEDPPAGARLIVSWDGRQCSATLPADLPKQGRLDLGELPCR